MHSYKRAKTTESGDMIFTEYKGKTFAIPKSEYKKPLQTIAGQRSQISNTDSVLSTDVKQPSNVANPFSLEALVESRETLLNDNTTPTPSAATLSKEKPTVIANSLLQLKSSVVDLIDKTISDIETKQQQEEKQDVDKVAYLHPGGDSPKAAATAHRLQNLQVLHTESFAQSKRDVRKKLYREIETILTRLKDMDFLE